MIDERIQKVIDENIRPLLQTHGGDMTVVGFEDGILRFRLTGACAGCSAADLTSEDLINKELTERIPEVKEAVMVTDVSPELLEEAKRLLRMRNGN